MIVKADGATSRMLGYAEGELVGHRSLEFIHPDDHALAIDNWLQMLAVPGPGRRVRLRHKRRDGSWIWLELTNHNLFHDAEYECAVSELVDISEEMAAHELVDRLARAVPVGLLQVNRERQIDYSNDRLHEILGVERTDSLDVLLARIAADDRKRLEGLLEETLEEGRDSEVEVEVHLEGGAGFRRCGVGLRALTQEEGRVSGAIACLTDVTESARMRDELHRRATFDDLTGCYNRAAAVRLLEEHIAAGGPGSERAVMFVDVDGFKAVNDRHGHVAGDAVLRSVAACLREALRAEDIVGRMGGDEFLIVCPEIGGRDNANAMAERLRRAAPVTVEDQDSEVALSVGVTWSRGEASDADTLVARADRAMYEAKRAKDSSGKAQVPVARQDAPTTDHRTAAGTRERDGSQLLSQAPRGGAPAIDEGTRSDTRSLGRELERHRSDVLERTIERIGDARLDREVLGRFEQFNVRSTVALARWLAAESLAVARKAGKDTWQFYGEMSTRHEVPVNVIIRRCLAWRDAVADTLTEIAAEQGVRPAALEYALGTLTLSLEYSLVRIAKSADSERDRTDDRLAFAATHDAPTGLPNRSLILDRTDQLLIRSRRHGTPVAALAIGLDDLKSITEVLGHDRTDDVLRAIAERMDGCVRDTDALGRIGEDEFIVIVEEHEEGDGALLLAERIRAALGAPFPCAGRAGHVTVSAHVGVAAGVRSSAEELIRDAGTAMHHARCEGHQRVAVFEPGMERAREHRHQLRVDLRTALANSEMALAYQPIAALADLRITGMEALLRWSHPTRGVVPPATFVPLLEEHEMIVEVGAWVLQEACRFGAECQRLGPTQISVNVSGRQLDHEQLLSQVCNALSANRLDANRLTLELTETTLMR
ncbi:MAG TPA: diguanylate cyclase, partial [Solirubrobacteraceae bacterium]|nr:diguanylate cyclase [Solirubrobacteraceae bacterium]